MITYPIGLLSQKGGAIPRTNLVAEWLGGSITDTSVNSYNGTLNGSPNPSKTTGINGVADTAWSFVSANSQYIDFGDIPEIRNVGKLSISTWFKRAASGNVSVGNCTFNILNGSFLLLDTTIAYASTRTASSQPLKSTGNSSTDWVHLVQVFDGSNAVEDDKILLYVNGVELGNRQGFAPALSPNIITSFKYGSMAVFGFSDGDIGVTRVYDRDLTLEEVGLLYAEKTI